MRRLALAMASICLAFDSGAAQAQHADVLLLRQGDKMVTGIANFDNFVWTVGARVFARDFDSDYEIENPGYNALSNSSPFIPMGYSALPVSTNVLWDFLPMTVPQVKSNFLYWNGLDSNSDGLDLEDVMFDTPAGYTLAIDGIGGIAAADGSDEIVNGPALVRTDSSGSIHSHRSYLLNSGGGSDPVDGIYLIALRVSLEDREELDPSEPFFLVFGTPGSTLAARNLAVLWVTQRVDSLVVDRIPGDYNDDGIVDAADYVVWRDTLGSMTNLVADGNGSEAIDVGDYHVWRENFGGSSNAQLTAKNVPEPSGLLLLLLFVFVVFCRLGRANRSSSVTPCDQLLRRRA